jgi:hypothetical protein
MKPRYFYTYFLFLNIGSLVIYVLLVLILIGEY